MERDVHSRSEIEEEMGIEEAEEEKIYVAVKKELKEGKSTLLWLLQNANKENKPKIVVMHVHIPFKAGKFPASKVEELLVNDIRQYETVEMLKKLDDYIHICTQHKIQAEKLVIESNDVARGIIELISLHGVEKLVMGAAADEHFSRRMKMPKSKTSITVRQQANSLCNIWFVCKGNLICTREFSHDTLSMGTPSPAMSISTPSSFRSDQLRTRSLPDTHPRMPFPNLSNHMSFPHSSRYSTSIPQSRSMSQVSLSTDPGDAVSENFQSSSNSFSSITNDMIHSLSMISVAKSEESEEGLGHLIEYSNENISAASSPNNMDDDIDTEVYDRLKEAHLEAEKSEHKAHQESIRRQKAERDVIEALRRAKTSENLYAKEMDRRKEAEASLAREMMEFKSLTNQRNEILEQLQTTMSQKSELELRIADSSKELAEAELLLSTLRAEHEELKLQRDAILEEVDRIKDVARVNSTNIHNFTEFSLSEIVVATSNFCESLKIGEGAYGNVYKGLLRNTMVAVKILNPDSKQGEQEFHHEVYVLSRVRHPNLITLIGICPEIAALIYEYLPNGSLEDHLNRKSTTPPLTWQARTRITAEICSGLIFLHSNKPHPIVHGDLKPENILLDHNLTTKLGDFGICRLLTESTTSNTLCHYTLPKGTFVYMDPEYLATGELTPKSDVYSFGVIMLRVLTGRQPFGIVKEVRHALDRNALHELIDVDAGGWPFLQAKEMARLGLWCCEIGRRNRPDLVGDVWRVLEPMTKAATSFSVYNDDVVVVPSYFMCPIFQEIMRDPHIASDGFTYEAEALKGWIEGGNNTSPMTNLRLPNYDLIPNRALRSAVQEWMQQHGQL